MGDAASTIRERREQQQQQQGVFPFFDFKQEGEEEATEEEEDNNVPFKDPEETCFKFFYPTTETGTTPSTTANPSAKDEELETPTTEERHCILLDLQDLDALERQLMEVIQQSQC